MCFSYNGNYGGTLSVRIGSCISDIMVIAVESFSVRVGLCISDIM